MQKQMMSEGGKLNMDEFKPMKEADYKKLTPAQKKAYDAKAKKATVDNLPNAADKARQAELDKEFGTYTNMPDTPKKMMKAGGMAKAYKEGGRAMKTMENRDPKSLAAFKKLTEKKKPIASKFEAKISEGKKKPTMKYKEGGMAKKPKAKARGYGMARGGKVCKMR
jgi:hypothetical protein